MKKLLLFVGLLFGSLCSQALTIDDGNLTYNAEDATKTAVVVGLSSSNPTPTAISIPSTVKRGTVTYAVTAIGENAFKENATIARVTIGNNAAFTSIEDGAFLRCSALKTIDGGATQTLGENAFAYCKNLSGADFAALTLVGEQAFAYGTNLEYVDAPNVAKINAMAFCYCTNLQGTKGSVQCTFPQLVNIGPSAFLNCVRLTAESFASSAKLARIDMLAFKGCASLTSAANLLGNGTDIPFRPVTFIGRQAFQGTAITEVVLPSTLTSLGTQAFANLKKLAIDCPTFLSSDSRFDVLNSAGLVNDGSATLVVGGNTGATYRLRAKFNANGKELHLRSLVIGDNIGNISSMGFYNLRADNITIGKNADFVSAPANYQMRCNGRLTVASAKLFMNRDGKTFTKADNLAGVFGNRLREIDATATSHFFETNGYYPTCSPYAFFTTGESELAIVKGRWGSVEAGAFFGNRQLAEFDTEHLAVVGDSAFYNCNLTYYKSAEETEIGVKAFANNPLVAIYISNEHSDVQPDAFAGTAPLMVFDMTDRVMLSGSQPNVKFFTKTDERAKYLRLHGVTCASAKVRAAHAAEDVDMSGSLTGDDAQKVYNAMK